MNWQRPTVGFSVKAGMLLRLKDGRVLLVGDINEDGGVCGCCRELQWPDISSESDLASTQIELYCVIESEELKARTGR